MQAPLGLFLKIQGGTRVLFSFTIVIGEMTKLFKKHEFLAASILP